MNDLSTDQIREIREAIAAGRKAYDALCDAENYLDSARSWGLLDLFGGGFISSMVKHSKMDRAQACMERAQYEVRNFSRELQDVSIHINFDGFTRFADWFFDGFFVDIYVQSKIKDAQRQVADSKRQVKQILEHLESML